MKGIILAGGAGTRLYPSTLVISKQLLTVYDKPMVYYPVSTLMMAGIRDILVISTPEHLDLYRRQLGDGSLWGLRFSYAAQKHPGGLAEAFIIGETFIGDSSVCLILGDNIFYGDSLPARLKAAASLQKGGIIFGYHVKDPARYGVLEFSKADGRLLGIEEKPLHPKSSYAVPGLYFFDTRAVGYARDSKPSARGELEITSVISSYIAAGDLEVTLLGRGFSWFDAGTHESLLEASSFVYTLEQRMGLKIACPEEIAFQEGYIDREGLRKAYRLVQKSSYGEYLHNILSQESF